MMRGLNLDGPPGVVEPLKAAFERKTAPGGGWTGDSSTEAGASAVRRFMSENRGGEPRRYRDWRYQRGDVANLAWPCALPGEILYQLDALATPGGRWPA